MRNLLLVIVTYTALLSCKNNNDCLINFYISGKITDSSGQGIQNVEIHYVTHYGFDSVLKDATTDSDGKFSYFEGSYSDLGNSYLYFKKTGYKDAVSSAIGKGNGYCGDQQIVRDAVMEPL